MNEAREVTISIDNDIYEWIERCRREHTLTSFVNMLLRENMPEYVVMGQEAKSDQ